jgi:uncharacterized membrane protein
VTQRLEAFSDGVFAIAITLLVLDIHVPRGAGERLGHELARQWPSYASYAVSFLVIGIIWVNHHAVFDHVDRADRPLMFLNLALLATVSVIPFPTSLLAEYLREGGDASHLAGAVYASVYAAMGIAFGAVWTYATRRGYVTALTPDEIRRATRRFTAGTPAYLASIGLAFVSAYAVLAISAAVAIYYAVEGGGGMRHRRRR